MTTLTTADRTAVPPDASAFAALSPEAPDALLALIGMHARDERPGKLDLGVGVYRDAEGHTPIFSAVKTAEHLLAANQRSKSYLGPEGDARFTALLAELLFGEPSGEAFVGLQTPGGTGALRLGAELLARGAPGRRIWIGDPTWANHVPVLKAAGLTPAPHRFFDRARSDLDFEAMMHDLAAAKAGDVLLLHGCCHNPTGISFSHAQWVRIADHCANTGVLPFIDLAYHGLGSGLDADAEGLRTLAGRVPEALVAYSCDKNFGLYRERVGALWVQAASPAMADTVRSNLYALARVNWSMPPDHGAAAVRLILEDPALRGEWQRELTAMRQRIAAIRRLLGAEHPLLAPIACQQGMFAMLPIDGEAVRDLRVKHGIYMAGNGRINLAGLDEAVIGPFVAALMPHLGDRQ
ncbi:amino acid aminotransferase [Sphingopyxis sp.]|uniref:amino acid aminotransferase n=1 Tax=Sphingopyxis sp. TaxID=1908224 RepID=UPI002ED81A87